jgi:two-component system, OmpR family, sensor histidine kinase KdpD
LFATFATKEARRPVNGRESSDIRKEFLIPSLSIAHYLHRSGMKGMQVRGRTLRSAATIPVLALITFAGYECHASQLTTGVIDLVLILFLAFRWGFLEGAVASAAAVATLDFFFMPPIFSLYERVPQDWIATVVFALIAIFLSRFADALHRQAADTDRERARLERLYLTSRDILLMDRGAEMGAQLTRLIEDVFRADAVALWDGREGRMDKAGRAAVADDEVRSIYFDELSESDSTACRFKRVLRLGTRAVGGLYLAGSTANSYLDSRSADAIASLSALALERAHSFVSETNAEAARRSGQMRSTVLDGLAHAFKTPLATIQTASEGLMVSESMGAAEKELASLIEEEVVRLANLTNKVLETAELDEAEFRLDYEKIELDEFLEECRRAFSPVVSDAQLLLSQEGAIRYVWADRRLLQMALLQMVDNAAKYARPGAAIALSVGSTDSEVVFSLRNEGSYVAPEERLRIFDRFYRSADAQHKAPGTGIGLAVTRRIAEAHRGRVWVDSTPDAETTFYFALPQLHREG